jgi:hypothetical protein
VSTVQLIRIRCEGAETQWCENGVDTTNIEEREARNQLEDEGWIISRRGDYCPDHHWLEFD